MAPEIVMIVEDQNAGAGIFSTKKMRGGQTTNTTTHDHKIVFLLGIAFRPGRAEYSLVHGLP